MSGSGGDFSKMIGDVASRNQPQEIPIDQRSLEQFIGSSRGRSLRAEELRGRKIFQGSDGTGYGENARLTQLFKEYSDWVGAENERLRQHADYVALSADRPGRQATILGSSLGNAQISVLGSSGY